MTEENDQTVLSSVENHFQFCYLQDFHTGALIDLFSVCFCIQLFLRFLFQYNGSASNQLKLCAVGHGKFASIWSLFVRFHVGRILEGTTIPI